MVSIVLLFFHFYSFFHFLDPFRQSFFCSAARCKFCGLFQQTLDKTSLSDEQMLIRVNLKEWVPKFVD
jgi:hypothetical protein